MKDQEAKKGAQELDVETHTCNTCQCDKAGIIAVGELTRSKKIEANPFHHGLEIMALLRDIVKHFESNLSNRKNYDLVSQDHGCLSTNAFERDLDRTRVSDVSSIFRSFLRLKELMRACCEQFDNPIFLMEDQCKASSDMGIILHDPSRLTNFCQNKNNLNACCEPVMRKIFNNGL